MFGVHARAAKAALSPPRSINVNLTKMLGGWSYDTPSRAPLSRPDKSPGLLNHRDWLVTYIT